MKKMKFMKKLAVAILFLAALIAVGHIFEHASGDCNDDLANCPVCSALSSASLNSVPATYKPLTTTFVPLLFVMFIFSPLLITYSGRAPPSVIGYR